MPDSAPDHYATLGLDRRCTDAQIRAAYRLLAKCHHPDVNPGSPEAMVHTQAINAAYETLGDAPLRRAYDEARAAAEKSSTQPRRTKIDRNIGKDAHLRIEDFLRGTSLEISVNDPANPNGAETFTLTVPPGTAPGTSFRLPREEPFQGGFVVVRVRALPGFRFKVRGSDLRCDLRIRAQRATTGGSEMIIGANGTSLRVEIPRNVGRGEVLRLAGEGLPKPRGGRGDLLVRIQYRPEVRITRTAGR